MPPSEMPICLGIFLQLSYLRSQFLLPYLWIYTCLGGGCDLQQQQQQRGCGDPVPSCPCCPCCPSPVQLADRAASEPGQPYVTVYYGRNPNL